MIDFFYCHACAILWALAVEIYEILVWYMYAHYIRLYNVPNKSQRC